MTTGPRALPAPAIAAWRWCLALLALLGVLFVAGPARAEGNANAEGPRDVPLVLQPSEVHLPPIPSGFRHVDHGWLHVDYTPHAEERLAPVLRAADDVKEQLEDHLGQKVLADVSVRVGRSAEEMAQLAPEGLPPPAYASGVAYPSLRLVLLTLSSPDGAGDAPDLEEVFRHELAHVALDEAVGEHHVPRWFNEGLAVHESGESRLARTRSLWDATVSHNTLPLSQLDQGFPTDRYQVTVAYAESADFVRFLLRDADRARFRALVSRVRSGTSFERALGDAYGTDLRKLEYEWREENSKRYTMIPLLTGGSLLWVGTFAAMIVGYVRRRRRNQATLARWAREEAAEDARAAAALAAVRAEEELPAMRIELQSLPKVHHDGSWHTLH